ncbi:MAG: hypothetical protein NVS3B20_17650 [Polyangiales bacterium]
MAIPYAAVQVLSFDYGHVLGGLDLTQLALRLLPFAAPMVREPDASVVARSNGDAPTAWPVEVMKRAIPQAYRAHDARIAAGEGHEQAWRSLMQVLVEAYWWSCENAPSSDAASRASSALSSVVKMENADDPGHSPPSPPSPPSIRRDSDTRSAVDALWAAQPTRNLWTDVPKEARLLLHSLHEAKVPMAITSNSEGRVVELLEQVGIAQYFSVVLDSGVLGFAKPDHRIFDLAAARLGAPLARMLHVGDSESADIIGAKSAGAWSVRFDGFVPGASAHPTIADARASTYRALHAIIEQALGLESEKLA